MIKKRHWWLSAGSIIAAASPVAVVASCAFIESFFQKDQEDAKKAGFGIWDNQTLDFASASFWNRPEVIKATGDQFNIWKDLALKGQSAKATMKTEVQFLDMGQADATLIQVLPQSDLKPSEMVANSFNILIDSGDFKTGANEKDQKIHTPFYNDKLKPTLQNALNSADKIDLFMFSHAHGDHIGQAAQVINDFAKEGQSIVINWGDIDQTSSGFRKMIATTIKKQLVYLDPFVENAIDIERIAKDANLSDPKKSEIFSQFVNPKDPNSKTYGSFSDPNNVASWVANGNKLFKMSPSANIINFAPDNFFAYLAPQSDYEPKKLNKSENENSINAMFKLSNQSGSYRMIFTGDAEGHTHEDMLDAINTNSRFQDSDPNHKLSVDLYKVAHHGSTTEASNNQSFLTSILKPTTKFIIQTNDNKLFSGSPTLKPQFFKNLVAAANANNYQDIANLVYITQNLGDIIFKFDNSQDLQKPQITFINRNEQIKQSRLLLKPDKVTTNLASKYQDGTKFEHLIVKN